MNRPVELEIKKFHSYYQVLDKTYLKNAGLFDAQQLEELQLRYLPIYPKPRIKLKLEYMMNGEKEKVKRSFLERGFTLI